MTKYIRAACLLTVAVGLLVACAGPQRSSSGPSLMGPQAAASVEACRPSSGGESFEPGPQFLEEMRGKLSSELSALEGKPLTIPIALNDDVMASVEYFTGPARNFMVRSLNRSGRYLPMMKQVLREKGLPEDLVYLALIESGYRVDAYSPAHAAGPWQFIAATGRRYGLKIDEWQDERMHPEKATRAAADYLADLYQMFGSWYLAAAAYNCGEGKILKGLKKYQATNFWEIAEQDFLREETKSYVPKFLAAILIGKDPGRFGLTGICPEPPELVDEVTLPGASDLKVIARLTGQSVDTIKQLNPHLKLWCTPVNDPDFVIRVPKGSADRFLTQFARLKPNERLTVSVHHVKSGESLSRIAARYSVSVSSLKSYNSLKSNTIYKGQMLKIPVGSHTVLAGRESTAGDAEAVRKSSAPSGKRVTHIIKPGESPWLIAQQYDVNWRDIADWNDIKDATKLQPGQTLVLYVAPMPGEEAEPRQAAETAAPAKPSPAVTTYTVVRGDTVSEIAHQFDVKNDDIRKWNALNGNAIRVGQVLKVASPATATKPEPAAVTAKADASQPTAHRDIAKKQEPVRAVTTASPDRPTVKPATYTVSSPNDTLWNISQRFDCSTEELRSWNGLSDNSIRLGQTLKVGAMPDTASMADDKTNGKPTAASTVPAEKKGADTPGPQNMTTYRVQQDDNLWKISRRFNVTPEELRAWNSMTTSFLKPGDVLKIGPGDSLSALTSEKTVAYQVKSGDTLWKIARRFKVNPSQIRAWNAMKDDRLRPGDVLTIRSEEG
nr:LysM peptidoglycan-binding domain-containing protein [uncultured Sphaerochaeta sp.]